MKIGERHPGRKDLSAPPRAGVPNSTSGAVGIPPSAHLHACPPSQNLLQGKMTPSFCSVSRFPSTNRLQPAHFQRWARSQLLLHCQPLKAGVVTRFKGEEQRPLETCLLQHHRAPKMPTHLLPALHHPVTSWFLVTLALPSPQSRGGSVQEPQMP